MAVFYYPIPDSVQIFSGVHTDSSDYEWKSTNQFKFTKAVKLFFEFAVNNDLTIDPEFKRDSKRWKGLVTIIATIPGITLNVDYLKINSI